jgi:hypothetical protein
MRNVTTISLLFLALSFHTMGQSQTTKLLSEDDFNFLEELTRDAIDSSRIFPGQKIANDFGSNNTGGILIRPGGRSCYPAFWIRDYAMSIESGFVTQEEQKHMLLLTAATQCDQTVITTAGSMIPVGAIADHIRIDDGKPIFFPGTYDFNGQGGKTWGMLPPYCDQFYFIEMAYAYVKKCSSSKILKSEINGVRLIDRLEMAYKVPPTRQKGVIIYNTDDFRGIDFGFRDAINITGDLCFPSLLKYKASLEMAELFELIKRKDKAETYRDIAHQLKREIPPLFCDHRGMLRASTGKSSQADVWSTALAVWFGVLEGEQLIKTCRFLAEAYKNGTLANRGNIRHILSSDDFNNSTAWETSLVKKNDYQNGAYWGTSTGWICNAIAKVDVLAAKKLSKEYIDDLRAGDFRKGVKYGAPWECYNTGDPQNAVYMATVTCPFIVFKSEIK